MSSPETGETPVSETLLLQAALPRNTVKRLARLAGVPHETARHWLYKHFSTARQREIARLLLLEMRRQDREERAAAMRWLAEMAGIDAATGDSVALTVAGAGADVAADLAGTPPQSARRRLVQRLGEFIERD